MIHRYMRSFPAMTVLILVVRLTALSRADEATIHVDARGAGRPVSRYLTGACIEDVNHEIYGGIYSQMLFGESFQEPPRSHPVEGFVAVDGEWRAAKGEVSGSAGPGPKLVGSVDSFTTGEAGVDVYLPGAAAGNAG